MKKKFFKKIIHIAIFILFIIFPCGLFAEDEITVLYTNSLNGYFDDCHCKEHPKGGLVMRAPEIDKIRQTDKNVFLFETGDFFPPESDDLLGEYLARGYEYIKYDSISVGDQEFSCGIEQFISNTKNLPLVCNNLLVKIKKKWEPVAERYRIIEKYNIKIGVIGTIADIAFKYYPKELLENVKILDQAAEIKKDIAALEADGIKYIFLLSHSGFERDQELAKSIKGIDLIVGGHSQTLLKNPNKTGETVIVQAGSDGARIGILKLSLSEGRVKIKNNSFTLPHLPEFKEDSNIRKLINEYNKEAEERYKKMKFSK